MPPRKKTQKVTKEEKEELNLKDQLSQISSDYVQVRDEEEASIIAMEFMIPIDVRHRRSMNLPSLLSKEDLTPILERNGLTPTDDILEALTQVKTLQASSYKKAFTDIAYLYNLKLNLSLKTKELEIKDGKKCPECGKMSCGVRNYQFCAGDEGTGRALQCTNPRCKAVFKLHAK